MKLKFFAVAMPLALMLSACDKQEDKFAGFTAVGTDKKAAKFYLDTNTVKRNRSGWVSFNMVRDLTDGYVIQNAETNCDNRFFTLEGVKYRQDGTSQEKFAAETITLPSDNDNADVTALVTMACDKAEENRMITGTFDDGKALEILKNSAPLTDTFSLLESKDFVQQGVTKHVLLTSTTSTTNSTEMLGVTIFEKNGNTWHIQSDYPFLKSISNENSRWHWEKIGKDHYGLIETTKNEIYVNELDGNHFKELIHYKAPEKEDYVDLDKTKEPWDKITYDNYKIIDIDSLNINFFDTNADYSGAFVVANYIDGTVVKQAYQFQSTGYVEIEILALKDLFGMTESDFDKETKKYGQNEILFTTFLGDNSYTVFLKTESKDFSENKISAISYKQVDGQWKVISKQLNFGKLDPWVQPSNTSKTKNLQLNSSNTALLVDFYSNGSSFVNRYEMVLVHDKDWRYLGDIEIISTCFRLFFGDPYGYTGDISVIQSAKTYPDLLVTKMGTEEDKNGKIIPAKNSLYIFNGKEYEVKKDTQVPSVKNEKVAAVQDTSAAKSSVMQMIDYAADNGGVGHESEIQEVKLKIESSPKPKKGNKKAARKINDQALALLNTQDFSGAVAKFVEANRLDASDIEIVNNLGFAYLKQKNLESAQQTLIVALTMFPDRAAAWSNLGDMFALSGDERKAVACYANTYRFSKDTIKTHQYMRKMNAIESVPELQKSRDKAMNLAQKIYPEIQY